MRGLFIHERAYRGTLVTIQLLGGARFFQKN
jgi:hypothetical protein